VARKVIEAEKVNKVSVGMMCWVTEEEWSLVIQSDAKPGVTITATQRRKGHVEIR
jgi:hypothetical protein